MAEVKNNFLKSKMNQDLDDRLIPNGEYRYANNISAGKTQSDDIGVLENILGNAPLQFTATLPVEQGLECIGAFMDNQNNRIFQFLTDYTDPLPNNITYPTSGKMRITVYDFNSPESYTVLVEGLFLNFAKNKQFRITGVNLIEGLLFWTDNRNQPRKINVSLANPNNLSTPTYYTKEDQISVAKYAPVDPITLYKKVVTVADGSSTANTVDVADATGIVPGMTLITPDISGDEFCVVTDVTINTLPAPPTITFYEDLPLTITNGTELTFLISTMTDKSSVPNWPGDPAFLEDKYVRFSYRFKYDDNEYSLMAPFTQIAYIPKQKGYFIAGNEIDAYRSTIINWFENNVNNIELIIPLPDKIGNLTSNYKIQEIDILYKESDALAVKVFETLPVSAINTNANTNNNYYIQPYQSQKPYKTLSDDQTTRVYDKVPVRARAQESAGNRIIYGNYYDKYTCVPFINYNVSIQPKLTNSTNFIEYPNHTLKKNRNYQVGFILGDKFGRQSSVILSSVDLTGLDLGGGSYAKGSTIYSSYENSTLFTDVRTWFGDTLILYLNAPINQQKDIPAGKPGLYAIPTSKTGFAITASTITDTTYTFTLDPPAIGEPANIIPLVGNIMRGFYTDYVTVTAVSPAPVIPYSGSYVITTSGRVGDIYNYTPQGGTVKDIKFSYEYNPIGWYSYKIVVKQQEQDYYNVYLPGMLNGYPLNQTSGSQVIYTGGVASLQNGINNTQFPVSETGNTSHIVLINDNINKVPRDLAEVGPDQKQYRSSVQLYGRVENTEDTIEIIGEDPLYSAKVTTITYDTATVGQGNWALIKPGDGIQCVEANAPVANDPPLGGTQPNPYRWLKDTVVVSNEVVGTTGTIILSSPNWILTATQDPNGDDYVNFIITRAENRQYFPTRKADTVISIATANEFNFLDNSANNLSGTAALNFYQLQNSPLIGRVSTVNKMGVIGEDMIPFLSVYETKPEVSILELFWETTTTGLISDLNADVLTGFSGPSDFSNFNYIHFENQDLYGDGEDTGAADSRYITDEFVVLNQNGVILPNTQVTLTSVFDGNGNQRIDDFEIETIVGLTEISYRLKISNRFVFTHDAPSLESYVFTFNVVDLAPGGVATTLSETGRLRNNNPIITTTIEENYIITQNTTNIVTLEANNGAFYDEPSILPSIIGLKWSIISGNTPEYFEIDELSGQLSLIDDQIPLGGYELDIKVQDAINTKTGAILPIEDTDFGTKSAVVTLNITVGDEPVPYWLRPPYESIGTINGGSTCGGVNFLDYTYGMVYIGPKEDFGPGYSYLPEIINSDPLVPPSDRNYQVAENIEVTNFSEYGIPGQVLIPTGLTEGEYRIKIKMRVPGPGLCDEELGAAQIDSYFKIYLYKRIYTVNAINAWSLSNTANNKPTSYELPHILTNSLVDDGNVILGQEKILTTSFTIEADPDPDTFYEWAIGVEMVNDPYNTASEDSSPIITFFGEDANFSYDMEGPVELPPIINNYIYNTNMLTVTNYTSALPRQTQDATVGLEYDENNSIIAGVINNGDLLVDVTLGAVNNQVAPGLITFFRALPNGMPLEQGKIVYVDPINPAIIQVQLTSAHSGGSINLVGKIANFVVTAGIGAGFGPLYANTIEGTEVKRFYTDPGFTQKWIPPFADEFYVFQTEKDYNPDDAIFTTGPSANQLKYTKFPYYCAQFNEEGEVTEQISPNPDSQTAWAGQNQNNTDTLPIANYSYNIYYEEPPA